VWNGYCSTDKRYARDNRLMILESPYRRNRLAPRCRLITSWSWSRFQGYGCSPSKVVRELGLERRETVRSLSTIIFKKLEVLFLVREDRTNHTYCVSVVMPIALPSSYVCKYNYWSHLSRKISSLIFFKIIYIYWICNRLLQIGFFIIG